MHVSGRTRRFDDDFSSKSAWRDAEVDSEAIWLFTVWSTVNQFALFQVESRVTQHWLTIWCEEPTEAEIFAGQGRQKSQCTWFIQHLSVRSSFSIDGGFLSNWGSVK